MSSQDELSTAIRYGSLKNFRAALQHIRTKAELVPTTKKSGRSWRFYSPITFSRYSSEDTSYSFYDTTDLLEVMLRRVIYFENQTGTSVSLQMFQELCNTYKKLGKTVPESSLVFLLSLHDQKFCDVFQSTFPNEYSEFLNSRTLLRRFFDGTIDGFLGEDASRILETSTFSEKTFSDDTKFAGSILKRIASAVSYDALEVYVKYGGELNLCDEDSSLVCLSNVSRKSIELQHPYLKKLLELIDEESFHQIPLKARKKLCQTLESILARHELSIRPELFDALRESFGSDSFPKLQMRLRTTQKNVESLSNREQLLHALHAVSDNDIDEVKIALENGISPVSKYSSSVETSILGSAISTANLDVLELSEDYAKFAAKMYLRLSENFENLTIFKNLSEARKARLFEFLVANGASLSDYEKYSYFKRLLRLRKTQHETRDLPSDEYLKQIQNLAKQISTLDIEIQDYSSDIADFLPKDASVRQKVLQTLLETDKIPPKFGLSNYKRSTSHHQAEDSKTLIHYWLDDERIDKTLDWIVDLSMSRVDNLVDELHNIQYSEEEYKRLFQLGKQKFGTLIINYSEVDTLLMLFLSRSIRSADEPEKSVSVLRAASSVFDLKDEACHNSNLLLSALEASNSDCAEFLLKDLEFSAWHEAEGRSVFSELVKTPKLLLLAADIHQCPKNYPIEDEVKPIISALCSPYMSKEAHRVLLNLSAGLRLSEAVMSDIANEFGRSEQVRVGDTKTASYDFIQQVLVSCETSPKRQEFLEKLIDASAYSAVSYCLSGSFKDTLMTPKIFSVFVDQFRNTLLNFQARESEDFGEELQQNFSVLLKIVGSSSKFTLTEEALSSLERLRISSKVYTEGEIWKDSLDFCELCESAASLNEVPAALFKSSSAKRSVRL